MSAPIPREVLAEMDAIAAATGIDAQHDAADTDITEWMISEGLADEAPADRVDLDVWLDRRLAVLAALERQIEQNTEVARRRIEMIRDWMETENAALQRRADFLRSLLEQAARAYPYPPKVKSRRLPNGTIGSRTVPARLEVVNEEAALRWAEECGFDEAIRKSVRVTPLREYWQSTGIVPEGCQEVPAEERFYVKAGGA